MTSAVAGYHADWFSKAAALNLLVWIGYVRGCEFQHRGLRLLFTVLRVAARVAMVPMIPCSPPGWQGAVRAQ
jgi:hypothetical protein